MRAAVRSSLSSSRETGTKRPARLLDSSSPWPSIQRMDHLGPRVAVHSVPPPAKVRRISPSGRVRAWRRIHCPTLCCRSRATGDTGAAASSASRSRARAPSVRARVRISFSLARVMATYSSRISSDIISRSSCRDTARRARVGYSTIRARSSPLGPTPSTG